MVLLFYVCYAIKYYVLKLKKRMAFMRTFRNITVYFLLLFFFGQSLFAAEVQVFDQTQKNKVIATGKGNEYDSADIVQRDCRYKIAKLAKEKGYSGFFITDVDTEEIKYSEEVKGKNIEKSRYNLKVYAHLSNDSNELKSEYYPVDEEIRVGEERENFGLMMELMGLTFLVIAGIAFAIGTASGSM